MLHFQSKTTTTSKLRGLEFLKFYLLQDILGYFHLVIDPNYFHCKGLVLCLEGNVENEIHLRECTSLDIFSILQCLSRPELQFHQSLETNLQLDLQFEKSFIKNTDYSGVKNQWD